MPEVLKAENTPVAAAEVVEQLTKEEAADRHRLEMKVEQGIQKVEQTFYQMGLALSELRDRRLYRSTHKNFGSYCQERFQRIKRRQAEYLILASAVVSDLKNAHNCADFPLPTSESQVRSMKDLTPPQRREVWQTGVVESGGEVPTAKTVKGIVERIKERDNTPPPIPFQVGDVVEICTGSHNGCWGIVTHVGIWSCTVHISVRNVNVQSKVNEMEKVDPQYTAEIRAVSERIAVLTELDLDPVIWSILETLSRQTCFTQIQLNSLAWAEQQYGISRFESKNI